MDYPINFILDCDGVIADFRKHSLDCIGVSEDELGGGKDKYCFFDWLEEKKRKELFKHFERQDFWETIPKYPWSDMLVDFCLEHGNVLVMTWAWDSAPGSFAGKHAWFQKHYPELPHWIGCHSASRNIAALAPRTILVDDRQENVSAFRDAGGMAFLWPAPYNNRSHVYPKTEDVEISDWENIIPEALEGLEDKVLAWQDT